MFSAGSAYECFRVFASRQGGGVSCFNRAVSGFNICETIILYYNGLISVLCPGRKYTGQGLVSLCRPMTRLLLSIILTAAPAAFAADAAAPVNPQTELAAVQAARLNSADMQERLDAVNRLAALPEGGAAEILYARFPAEEDAYARVSMTEAFAALRSSTALAGLLLALEDANPSVRQSAAIALSSFEAEAVTVPALERLAASEADERVLRAAARTLGSYRGDRAADAAAFLLSLEGRPELQLLAVEALGRIGTPRAEAVLDKAAKERGPAVKSAAAAAAARLKARRGKR